MAMGIAKTAEQFADVPVLLAVGSTGLEEEDAKTDWRFTNSSLAKLEPSQWVKENPEKLDELFQRLSVMVGDP